MAGAVIRISGDFDDAALKKASAALGKFGVNVDGISKKSSAGFGSVSTKAVAMGAAIARVGTDIAYALGRKAVDAIGSSINAARDMNETVSKVGVIFGDQADEINKFASTAASQLGLSKQAAMDAASTFATFGKSAGLAGQDLTGFSTQLTGLSSDLASFYNTSPEDAITAIGAALRGENEPIRKYGILLDDATLRQQALELGIVSTTKNALTPSQKVLAAQAAILKQTGDASGDFARTSGGLANQQRILAAQVDNVKTVFGQAFLPVVLKVTTAFTSKLLPAITEAADWAQKNLGPAIESLTGKLGGLFSGTSAGASILSTFVGYIKSIGSAFVTYVMPAIERAMPAFQTFFGVLKNSVLPVFQDLVGFIATQVVPVAAKLVAAIIDIAGILLKHLAPVVKAVAEVFQKSIIPAVKQLWEKIKPLIDVVIELGKNLATIAGTIISTVAPIILKIAGFLIRNLAPAFGVVIDIIKVVVTIVGKVVGVLAHLGDAFNTVKDVALKAWNLLMTGVEFVINKIIGFFNGLIRAWNLVPFHDDVNEIASVSLPRVGQAADEATAKMATFGRAVSSAAKSAAIDSLWAQSAFTATSGAAVASSVAQDDAAKAIVAAEQDKARKVSESQAATREEHKKTAEEAKKAAEKQIAANKKIVADQIEAATKRRKVALDAAQSAVNAAKTLFDGVKNEVMASFDKIVDAAKSKVETLTSSLDDLKKNAKEFSKSFVDGLRSFANLANYAGDKIEMTGAKLLEDFRKRITQTFNFLKQIADLRALGLNETSLQEIISSGAETGSQIAAAVLEGGKGAVDEINSLQSQFESESAKLGDILATDRFGEQIKTAGEILDSAKEDLATAQARQKVFADLFDTIEAKFSKILKSKTEALDKLKTSLDAALSGEETAMTTLINAVATISNAAIAAAQAALGKAQTKAEDTGLVAGKIGDTGFLDTVAPGNNYAATSTPSSLRPKFMDTVAPYKGGSKTTVLTLSKGAVQIDASSANAEEVGDIFDRKLRNLIREMSAQ